MLIDLHFFLRGDEIIMTTIFCLFGIGRGEIYFNLPRMVKPPNHFVTETTPARERREKEQPRPSRPRTEPGHIIEGTTQV